MNKDMIQVTCYACKVPRSLPPPGDSRAFYVIDLAGYVFRAYHALPPLSSSTGEPTHAVRGVVSMLRKLEQQVQPVYWAAALDSKVSTERVAMYSAYKANRPEPPPDLSQQMTRVIEWAEKYGMARFGYEGMEADDVIASLVRWSRSQDMHVVIVSADKDLLQLVSQNVTMYDPMRNRVFGPEETVSKFGVPPEQVRDFLALTGDTSDNVPGVPSVGPKTAASLLTEFGSLEGIYANLDGVSRKSLRGKLESHRDEAFLSQRLVSLRSDLELDVRADMLEVGCPDSAALRAFYEALEFRSYLADLDASTGPVAGNSDDAAPLAKAEFTPLQDLETLKSWLAEQNPGAALLTLSFFGELEALGKRPGPDDQQSVLDTADQGLALAVGGRVALLVDAEQTAAALGWLCTESSRPGESLRLGVWESKSCSRIFASLGVACPAFSFDAYLAAYLVEPSRPVNDKDAVLRRVQAQVPELPEGLAPSACDAARDALMLAMAAQSLEAQMRAQSLDKLLQDVELPLAYVLCDMENRGVAIDSERLNALAVDMRAQLGALEAKATEQAGHAFNLNSPRQLETILFDELGLPVKKRTKTSRSTDSEVLEELGDIHPLPAVVLEYRGLAKLLGTYVETLPKQVSPATGRLHSTFHQTVAATGRLSSSDPNVQNIPIRTELGRAIRDAFVAPEGMLLLSADYSQIELRVLAHLAEDEALSAAFVEGEDVHRRTASALFDVPEEEVTREMRAQGKTVNFAVIYGQTQFALAKSLGISRADAKRYIQAFFARYSGVRTYFDALLERAREEKRVHTMLGRTRPVPDITSRNHTLRAAAERVACNTPIQGSAADILKVAMVRIHNTLRDEGLSSRMVLTVHDELVLEVPEQEQERVGTMVQNQMSEAVTLRVPLVVDVGWGKTWAQAH